MLNPTVHGSVYLSCSDAEESRVTVDTKDVKHDLLDTGTVSDQGLPDGIRKTDENVVLTVSFIFLLEVHLSARYDIFRSKLPSDLYGI